MPGSFNPLQHPILFSAPKRLLPFSSDHVQIPLAMLLVDLLKPRVVVEVGTYLGESYCAFCQAIKELSLSTRAFGFGAWSRESARDPGAKSLWADLSSHHDALYSDFSSLQFGDSDEPVQLAPTWIDLLHMIGYDQKFGAPPDFDRWISKVSDRGVVWLEGLGPASTAGSQAGRELSPQLRRFSVADFGPGQVLAIGAEAPEQVRALMSDTLIKDLRFFLSFLSESRGEELRARALTSKALKQQTAIVKLQLEIEGLVREKAALDKERAWLRQVVQQMQATRIWKIGTGYWRLHAWARSRLVSKRTGLSSTDSVGATMAPAAEALNSKATTAETPGDNSTDLVRPSTPVHLSRELNDLVSECEDSYKRTPSFLDWNTGLNVASMVKAPVAVYSGEECFLPYLDQSIDIVIHPNAGQEWESEAKRVARIAVVRTETASVSQAESRSGVIGELRESHVSVEWLEPHGAFKEHSITFILTSPNALRQIEQSSHTFSESLPRVSKGEFLLAGDEADPLFTVKHGIDIKCIAGDPTVAPGAWCDRAAEAATGELFVFLAEATILRQGWTEALLRTMREHEGVGVVAAKICGPSGRLRSAGSIVLADGSLLQIGQEDETPSHPMYDFVRETDACPPAFMASTRAAFKSAGRFCEDYETFDYTFSDFCLRIVEKGCRVLYQPEVAAIAPDGVATEAAKDLGDSPLARDRAKFVECWFERLKLQPLRPIETGRAAFYHLLPGKALGENR